MGELGWLLAKSIWAALWGGGFQSLAASRSPGELAKTSTAGPQLRRTLVPGPECVCNKVPVDTPAGPEATGFEGNGINSNCSDLAEIPGGNPYS